MENIKEQKLTEEQEKNVIVNKVKAGKYLSDEELEKLRQITYSEDLCDYNSWRELLERAQIIKKIKEKKEFSECELEELAFESECGGLFENNLVEVIKRDDTRWSKNMTTVLEFDGELYAIDWRKGLTEQQENAFYKQPYKVRKTERVITITDYERIEE